MLRRVMTLLPAMLFCFVPTASAAEDVIYMATKDGRVHAMVGDASLSGIASSSEFPGVSKVAALESGNVALLNGKTAQVWVCNPAMERLSYRSYPNLERLVDVTAIPDGRFILAGINRINAVAETQTGILANRNIFRSADVEIAGPLKKKLSSRILSISAKTTSTGCRVGMVVRHNEPERKPGIWYCKAVVEQYRFASVDARHDLPGASATFPLDEPGDARWIVIGGGEMASHAFVKNGARTVLKKEVEDPVATVALPEGRFALANARGDVTLWRYRDTTLEQLAPTVPGFGDVVAMSYLSNGDLVVGSADGTIRFLPVPKETISGSAKAPFVTAEKTGLGTMLHLAVARGALKE